MLMRPVNLHPATGLVFAIKVNDGSDFAPRE
jgi:hypothetical protein